MLFMQSQLRFLIDLFEEDNVNRNIWFFWIGDTPHVLGAVPHFCTLLKGKHTDDVDRQFFAVKSAEFSEVVTGWPEDTAFTIIKTDSNAEIRAKHGKRGKRIALPVVVDEDANFKRFINIIHESLLAETAKDGMYVPSEVLAVADSFLALLPDTQRDIPVMKIQTVELPEDGENTTRCLFSHPGGLLIVPGYILKDNKKVAYTKSYIEIATGIVALEIAFAVERNKIGQPWA